MTFEFEKDIERQMLASIKRFFSEELEEDIGDIKAKRVMDYFIKEIAPGVYNQAVSDVQKYLTDRTAELSDVFYADEFNYWKKK